MTQAITNTPTRSLITRAPGAGVNKRLAADKLASRFIALGGWIILFVICAIIIVILSEALPLFGSAKITQSAPVTQKLSIDPKIVLTDEYQEQFVTLGYNYEVSHFDTANKKLEQNILAFDNPNFAENSESENVKSVEISSVFQQENLWFIGNSVGYVQEFKAAFTNSFDGSQRITKTNISLGKPIQVTNDNIPLSGIAAAETTQGLIVAGHNATKELFIATRQQTRSLMGVGTVKDSKFSQELPITGNITTLAMDNRGEVIVIGSSKGELLLAIVKNGQKLEATKPKQLGPEISNLQYALGGRTVIVGQVDGSLTSWQPLRIDDPQKETAKEDLQAGYELVSANTFEKHSSKIIQISPSLRSKVFVSLDANNQLAVHYSTTGKTLAKFFDKSLTTASLNNMTLTPKADGILTTTTQGEILKFDLHNPHPEISLKALFGKVQYEGYRDARHVWQSTGGTDSFEPKLGLMPLIFGTLKGAFYALMFSLPLAILAAIYTSLFMPPRLKAVVKPVLELMAALPSVVIGFVAGLWLAPILEPHLLAIVVVPVIAAMTLVIACLLSWMVRTKFKRVAKAGSELFLALPILLVASVLAFYFSGFLEQILFAGNLKVWLYDNFAINVDQRNSIIAGIAVGFAVIPIIFTISEDCITSVPRTLTAGGLALGATRWQTALKVVLPVAAPGIFAAVMIGIGRAVGETMIVLMATGNTPLMDPSAFTGFRALSANIAVELPEAPHGGTLYRILFLTAFILFIMTFILNALSELVRMRLRKKLGGAH